MASYRRRQHLDYGYHHMLITACPHDYYIAVQKLLLTPQRWVYYTIFSHHIISVFCSQSIHMSVMHSLNCITMDVLRSSNRVEWLPLLHSLAMMHASLRLRGQVCSYSWNSNYRWNYNHFMVSVCACLCMCVHWFIIANVLQCRMLYDLLVKTSQG